MTPIVAAVTPEYRDFISAGTYIVGTLIVTLGAVLVPLINRTNNNAKKAANYAEPVGNGFASHATETLRELSASLGGLHSRMDRAERRSDETRQEIRQVLVNFDNRITAIEDDPR